MEDSSLEDFLGGGEGDEDVEEPGRENEEGVESEVEKETGDGSGRDDENEGAGAAKDDDEPGTEEVPTAETDVEPATGTMVYAPAGAPCDDCGEVVTRRWRADGGLHCLDCKEW